MKKPRRVRPPKGTVRPNIVAEARRKLAQGDYDGPEVITDKLANRIIDDLYRKDRAA